MIKNGLIRIELMSDMCVSDGSAYNSQIDTDLCSDRYGLPYIPAKRIRGCLRECALELNDWGDEIDTDLLFGDKGERSKRAKIRLSNAYLDQYEDYKAFVLNNHGHMLTHPQNVLKAFSYVRTQTSIDYETGVADDASLRAMRVADKGLVFEARVQVEEKYYEQLERCCSILRHMGIARTRGFGEVKVTLQEAKDPSENIYKADHAELMSSASELHYEISLVEPVICKSVNGGEARTLDYIEGSKILGLISENLDEDYLTFMSRGKLCCTNAYISREGIRYTEIPGYIYKIKNDKSHYVNRLADPAEYRQEMENVQLSQMKHCYAAFDGNELCLTDVKTEERYHHRRPDDKSIGRAAAGEDNEADFYQMESISEGQTFAGKISGSPEQIEKVYGILTRIPCHYIGFSKSSEYGKVTVRVTKTCGSEKRELVSGTDLVVNLNAPAIIYNDHAMASSDPGELQEEILASLKKAWNLEAKPVTAERYIKNVTLGGYNVTWNRRKPTIQAFDKGTAIRFRFAEPVTIPDGAGLMIGERTAEGYGEASIICFSEEKMPWLGPIREPVKQCLTRQIDASSAFACKLAGPLLDAFLRRKAVDAVREKANAFGRKKGIYKPTVSNMMLLTKEYDNIEDVRKAIEDRYGKKTGTKPEKKEAAEEILRSVSDARRLEEDFARETGICNMNMDRDEMQMKYLREFLTQMKYSMRGDKGDV